MELKEKCKLEFVSVKPYELANGEIVEEDVYLAELIVNDKILVVETTLTRSEIALIGMELIRNKIAVFNLTLLDFPVAQDSIVAESRILANSATFGIPN